MGHEVISCDVLPAEDEVVQIMGTTSISTQTLLPIMGANPIYTQNMKHVVGDVFEALHFLFKRFWIPDLAIFHITCTYLTNSAAWAFSDPDYERYPGVGYHQRVKPGTLTGAARRQAREASKDEFRRVLALPIARKVVENPIGALSQIRKPTQIVQPYQFGDDASKGTCFWYIGANGDELPDMALPIDPAAYCKPRMVCDECKKTSGYDAAFGHGCTHCGAEAGRLRPRWSNQTDTGQNRLSPDDDRWKDRSRTFPGIADAASKFWAACCENRI